MRATKSLPYLRHKAFVRQHCRCYYCNHLMWEKREPEHFAHNHGVSPESVRGLQCTAEHLLAKQDGGKVNADNIVAACLACNRKRHQGRTATAPEAEVYRREVARQLSSGCWHHV